MKLISKTILYYLFISVPLLLIAVFFSYRLIRSELKDGTDEDLQREKQSAEKLIRSKKHLQNAYLSFDSLSNIEHVENALPEARYSDTSIYDPEKGGFIAYRMLKAPYSSDADNYRITVLKPTLEEDELVEGLLSAFALITAFLVFSFFIVNWLITKTLWKPFYTTLGKLNTYQLKDHEKHIFIPAKTTEFDQLNKALNKMTEKIYTDFIQQKEFTENASHEMQTPLAVIKANLSLLMQSPNLKEAEMNHLEAMENTTKKLSSLNKALLLLSKIENNQFKESEVIDLSMLITKTVDHFSDVMQAKDLHLSFETGEDLTIKMHPALADILITNLLQNAVRHNREGGSITIKLSAHTLVIANSGEPLNVEPQDLFVRFKKNDASKDSLGLGLAIVKSIVFIYGFKIEYSYPKGLHTFTLSF